MKVLIELIRPIVARSPKLRLLLIKILKSFGLLRRVLNLVHASLPNSAVLDLSQEHHLRSMKIIYFDYFHHRVMHKDSWNYIARELQKAIEISITPGRFTDSYHKKKKLKINSSAESYAKISVIVSLYKSDEYLDFFLANIMGQTIFPLLEICIVAVKPSDYEKNLLETFSEDFKNVQLIVMQERVNIYTAWNIAIQKTRSPLITNANVDDIRRNDSFEVQVKGFEENPWADVIYQDVFYSHRPNVSWDLIEAVGSKSKMPSVSLPVLLSGVNPPHNAPAWRRSIHTDIGMFNEKYSAAGDYEFWLRCVVSGKEFFKIRDAHVSYFFNPDGISTKVDSLGAIQTAKIRELYSLMNLKEQRQFATNFISNPSKLTDAADLETIQIIEDLLN